MGDVTSTASGCEGCTADVAPGPLRSSEEITECRLGYRVAGQAQDDSRQAGIPIP